MFSVDICKSGCAYSARIWKNPVIIVKNIIIESKYLAFINSNIDWVHLDCFAWEQNGKAGRPKGGADTGMRAIAEFIKDRYA